MAIHEDDRAAYLAGDDRRSLTPGERAELDELRGLLASPATWAQPDADLEDRVVQAIAEEAGTRPPATRQERRSWLRRPRRRRMGRPAFGLELAAAAAVALIAVVLVATKGSTTPQQQLAMAVSGTRLAPSAAGSGTLTKTDSGWRIHLEATGLPRLSGPRYYEGWLTSAKGVFVPVGTFDDAHDVTLWAGVPPSEYPSFTVTLQRVGGSPASSGERVLIGAIRLSH
jgi:hypothetical protein